MVKKIIKICLSLSLIMAFSSGYAQDKYSTASSSWKKQNVAPYFGWWGLKKVVLTKWANSDDERRNPDFYSAWGIGHFGVIWGYDEYTWHYLGHSGVDIDAGGGVAAVVKRDSSLWIWNGSSFKNTGEGGTKKIDISADGTPLRTLRSGRTYEWDNEKKNWKIVGKAPRSARRSLASRGTTRKLLSH